MKYFIVIANFIFISFFMYGCDSPSESKATPVTAPKLLAPADNQTGVSLTPNFKWETAAHIIQIDYNNTFNPPAIYNYDGLNGITEYTLPPQIITEHSKTFFWRIGVKSGSSTTWSTEAYRFTTIP